ncbi:hypothetical protein BDV18DRAFT_127813 [Aspergillus unguis]
MASLQESLLSLNSTPRDKVPSSDQAALREYITDLRRKARTIADSVPEPPPPSESSSTNADTKSTSKSRYTVTLSPARLAPKDSTVTQNQSQWSKSIVKPTPGKDNPLGIPVYKLQGSDGQGHWFGRRSVHAGLPYKVWEEKIRNEMAETLVWNEKRLARGQPPDKAVRGIGAREKVEVLEIRDEENKSEGDGQGKSMGKATVYHVSASFPRPTTSRDFVVMIVTWEDAFEAEEKEEREGRTWMMVSKPIEHPDAPPSDEYIRGQYESVEMIREIVDGSNEDAESNPVEWTMVTRSDPGGTIPRWMVEKGTPKSICTDAAKFLEWASRNPEIEAEGEAEGATKERARSQSVSDSTSDSSSSFEYEQEEHHGLIASFGNLLNAGMERYAPQAVLDYMPQQSHSRQSSYNLPNDSKEHQPRHPPAKPEEADETTSIASSLPTEPNTPGEIPPDSTAADILQRNKKGKLSSHEKQLAKLALEKRSVEAKLSTVRSDIYALGLRNEEDKDGKTSARASVDNPANPGVSEHSTISPNSSMNKLSDRTPASNSTSATSTEVPTNNAPAIDNPELSKIASGLFREESKLLHRLSKIERHQAKEATKIEARQRKEAEKQDKAKSRDEVDSLKKELDGVKKERDRLQGERKQWLSLIKSLQAENSKLAKKAGEKGRVVKDGEVESGK